MDATFYSDFLFIGNHNDIIIHFHIHHIETKELFCCGFEVSSQQNQQIKNEEKMKKNFDSTIQQSGWQFESKNSIAILNIGCFLFLCVW